ncbi:toprim domain-containing protein [uncultured Sulfitobacter sp.]|uniref:toprim domain-containing protein n=1 Tax=uncultured Sulfitobacter sp. TaxID=191468 RepID=UPI0026262921|nr:toprim domain-containing protein [uncultured Sulfitobacter sp.]
MSKGAGMLTQAKGGLFGCEGVEAALSLASGLLSAPTIIWAALSTSGVRAENLPSSPGKITIATDGDDTDRVFADRADSLGWKVISVVAPVGHD